MELYQEKVYEKSIGVLCANICMQLAFRAKTSWNQLLLILLSIYCRTIRLILTV